MRVWLASSYGIGRSRLCEVRLLRPSDELIPGKLTKAVEFRPRVNRIYSN